MASFSSTYPAQRPVFTLDAANAGRLDSRMTFTRSDTPPTYAAPSAVHFWSNEKHLSSENLVLQSSSYNTTWSELRLDLTGSQTDPSGGTGAWKLAQQSGQTNAGEIYQYVNVTAARHVLSFYAKAGTNRNFIQLTEALGNGTAKYSYINLSTGAAATVDPSHSFTVTAVGSTGWYRISVPLTPNLARSAYIKFKPIESDASVTVTDNQGFIYLWGVQLEQLDANGPTPINQTTTQIHRAYAPTLKSVATAGQPRFEYDPASDGQSMGILIEGQSTNLLAGSATIGGTYWGVVNATAQQNSAVAPDGTLTAATLVENSAGGSKVAYTNNFTPAASTTYTFSAFVKPNGRNFCMIYTGIGGVNQSSMFDLGTGSTSNLSGSGVNRATQCGNGWWRLSVTVTTTSTATHNFQILPASDATTIDYTGNGYSGLLCWGAMLEQSSFASSYIATTSSAVTRAAESLSMTDASLFDNGGGTLYAEASRNAVLTYNGVFSVDDGTNSNIVQMFGIGSNFRTEIKSGGTAVANMIGGAFTANTYHKQCVSFGPTEAKYYVNGSQIGSTDTDLNIPAMSQIHLGVLNASGNHLNGHIKRVALYNEALSDTNLQALTS